MASLVTCTTTVTANYSDINNHRDYAKVTFVEPIYKNHTIRTPYQDCYTKQVRQNLQGDGSYTNELFGGLLGGAIGNQFGKGDGKTAMTGVGALLGASIANDSDRRRYRTVNQDVCETRYRNASENRLDYYLVTFDYQGETYSAKTRRSSVKEGDSIKVRVNVTPVF